LPVPDQSTPHDGLPSRPMSTTLYPSFWYSAICGSIGSRILMQCVRYPGVSYCSLTHHHRLVPNSVVSGQGSWMIPKSFFCRISISGLIMAGKRANPFTFAFWLSKQWAMTATFLDLLSSTSTNVNQGAIASLKFVSSGQRELARSTNGGVRLSSHQHGE
jgi:hypothetical protein